MRIPLATYRIQFTDKFTFRQATDIVDYLADLGISDLYAAPVFQAKDRSVSGYDVIDPTVLNAELGTAEDFDAVTAAVKRREMGWLQDIVPNHMGYYGSNKMLADVMEKGPASKHYEYFDIDWNHPYESLRGRLLAPFLARFYGESLENGEIELKYSERGFRIHYYDFNFPLNIESYYQVLTHNWNTLRRKLGTDHTDLIKLCGLLYVLKNLPKNDVEELYDQITFIKRLLWELYGNNPVIRHFIESNIEQFNGRKGKPETFHLLDTLLSEQFFRLSYWKVATQEIDYRRFFTINDLISLRVEKPEVFNDVHALIMKLVKAGGFTGLRVDHIDGLHDPTRYLERLKEKAGDTYILVEKILELDEELPSFWPIQGTTGYEFANFLNGIFCNGENESEFSRIYVDFTGFAKPYEQLWYENKKLIVEKDMSGDMSNLARLAKNALSEDRHGGDITLFGMQKAITEVMSRFPVYRTYITPDVFRPVSRLYIEKAINDSRKAHPDLAYELNFIKKVLLLETEGYLPQEEKMKRMHFVMRFQQFTGPLMAKGFEDTTLYVYNRFVSLNEVGGSPDKFGISIEKFHDFNSRRAAMWPYAMNATATHDTKRGEDVRARLNVLSEIPHEWEERIRTWAEHGRAFRKEIGCEGVLDKNTEYLLYQTLVGAMPFEGVEADSFEKRVRDYMWKSVREAKVHTEWVNPDVDYEEAVLSFVGRLLDTSKDNPFLSDFLPFQRKIARYGIWNSLSQALLKIASPGAPDFYQGTELWDLNLVDPDNRRPVDFERRKAYLGEILDREGRDMARLIEELLASREDGRIKMFLIHRALLARKERSLVFREGRYYPLSGAGTRKDHVVAFARKTGDEWAACITPRFLTPIVGENDLPFGEQIWQDTYVELPDGVPAVWRDAITGQKIEGDGRLFLGRVLGRFPVALLLSEGQQR